MTKRLLASASLCLLASSAIAADLPSHKAPPPAPAPITWTGFHVGLNAGGVWGNNNGVTISSFPISPYASSDPGYWTIGNGNISAGNKTGFIGGGQIGYDWQSSLSGYNFVTGFEADFQGIAGAGGSGSRSVAYPVNDGNIFSSISASRNLQYLGTVRARVGYLVTPTLLIYGTGGFAYGGVTFNLTGADVENSKAGVQQWTAVGDANYSNTLVGWTGGGGLEWLFLPNWSAKAEYLYYDLGNASINSTSTLIPVASKQAGGAFRSNSYSGNVSGNLVRAGVNYHFNWGKTPVVAKF